MNVNVKFQVLGYRNFNKKADNSPLTVVTVMFACTPDDNAHGAFGNRTNDFFLPDDKVGTLTPECIGQEFIPQYGISGFGKPIMVGFEIKPWK